MPPVDHLLCLGCGRPGGFGVRAGPVPADDLDVWMLGKPGRHRLRFTSRQDIDRAAGFQVDDDGGVLVPTAQREVIDPHHPHRRRRFLWHRPNQPQHRVFARRLAKPARQARRRPGRERHRDRRQRPTQQRCLTGVGGSQLVDLFGECPRLAPDEDALETAHEQDNDSGRAADRRIGQPPPVPGVHPCGRCRAPRAALDLAASLRETP
jgi:hypothetical protein